MNDLNKESIEQLISKVTHPKKRMFLDNYYKFANTKKTAVAIGLAADTPYQWIVRDKVFKSVLSAVKKRIDTDRLEEIEAEIHDRALDRDAYGSSILLMFEAKALDPGKYREKPAVIPITGDITIKLGVSPYLDQIPKVKEGAVQGQSETKQLSEATNETQKG